MEFQLDGRSGRPARPISRQRGEGLVQVDDRFEDGRLSGGTAHSIALPSND